MTTTKAATRTTRRRTRLTRKATPTHNVAVTAPKVAALWCPTNPVRPEAVHPGTGDVYRYVCPAGPDHVWDAAVKSLTGAGTGCPACANKQVSVTNRLDILYPAYAAEWHPTRNDDRLASHYVHGSGVVAHWLCPRGHSYTKAIVKRTLLGQGCPECRIYDRSIAAVCPDLVASFCPDSNGDLTPATVAAGSTTPVIWCCEDGHHWPATPDNRRRGGTGCPDCAKVRATAEFNLATEAPVVAAGYHPTLNTVPVTDVHPRSETPRYFVCADNPAHVWLAQPAARTRAGGTGCPVCNLGGWTVAAVGATLAAFLVDGTVEDLTATERAVLFHCLALDTVSDPATSSQLGRFVAGTVTLDDVYLAVGNDPAELARVKDIRAARLGHLVPADEQPDAGHPDTGLRVLEVEAGSPFDEDPGADARAILRPLASPTMAAVTVEGQALDTLLHTRVDALWRRVVTLDPADAPIFVAAVAEHLDGATASLLTRVAARFCDEYAACATQPLPVDWKSAKVPHLMQRLTAHRAETNRRVANWSGTGAGKTISALLTAGTLGADLTVVFCPNGTIDTWKKEIREVYPDAAVLVKTLTPNFDALDPDAPMRFLLLNFEKLQQSASRARLENLLALAAPAFVVVDELHNVKQRAGAGVVSQRKELLGDYLAAAAGLRPELAVLAMTATPVLNDLHEARSLVELVTAQQLPEIGTRATIANAYAVYAALARVGLRLSGKREPYQLTEVPVDVTHALPAIADLGPLASVSAIEVVLVRERMPAILAAVDGPTIVYTHYVTGVVPVLVRALRDAGFTVGEFTGENKTGLKAFLDGKVQVLVASGPISTGIDGLQDVCHNMVISCPPWTWSETEQLIGRLARQGQARGTVQITIPVTTATVGEEDWSWDGSRLDRLKFKRQLAEAAVDGVVADEHDVPVTQVVGRLKERAAVLADRAQQLVHPATQTTMVPRRHVRSALVGPARTTSPFSRMNQLMNRSHSTRTAQRFTDDPALFDSYHDLLTRARQTWAIDPLQVTIEALRAMPGAVIGDFGCGDQPRIAHALGAANVVHSFDHRCAAAGVTAGDMRSTPLADGTLDVAVFCQSLMGSNAADYVREAHRTLATGGLLVIWETTSRVRPGMVAELALLGFDEVVVESYGRFTQLRGVRADRMLPAWAPLTLGKAAATESD